MQYLAVFRVGGERSEPPASFYKNGDIIIPIFEGTFDRGEFGREFLNKIQIVIIISLIYRKVVNKSTIGKEAFLVRITKIAQFQKF